MGLPSVLKVMCSCPTHYNYYFWPTFARCKWRSEGTALSWFMGNGQSIGSTVSDVLSVAGCGQLKLGAAHWATSVLLVQIIINPTNCGSRFSTGGSWPWKTLHF